MYIFNDEKFLSEWTGNSYSGITLSGKSRKKGFPVICSCGFNDFTNDSLKVCPNCGKSLFVIGKRFDDIVENATNIAFKFKLVPDSVVSKHIIAESELEIIAKKLPSKDIEICLAENVNNVLLYDSLEDAFFKNGFSHGPNNYYYWNFLNLAEKSFQDISSKLSSRVLNIHNSIVAKSKYLNVHDIIDRLPEISKTINNYKNLFTEENVEKYPFLLRHFLNGRGKSLCSFPDPSVVSIDDLFGRIGFRKTARPYVNLVAFDSYSFGDSIKVLNILSSNEIPYSKYFLELLCRDIISFGTTNCIIDMYDKLCNNKTVYTSYHSVKTKDIEYFDGIMDSSMAEIFINFVKKNINLSIDYISEFVTRYQNLIDLGEMPTEDNICREYYRIVNRSRFSYTGPDDAETAFKKDPLEAIKNMK